MLNVIESIRMRLKRRVGCFGLYGYDFMVDEDMKVWLIEINVNPALTTNTNTLVQAIPPVVKESICKIRLFAFQKNKREKKKSFLLVHFNLKYYRSNVLKRFDIVKRSFH